MKIRFILNEIGLNVEYYAHGDWRSAGMLSNEAIKNHGGVSLLKTKVLHSLYGAMNMQQEIMPPGEYHDNGTTVVCV